MPALQDLYLGVVVNLVVLTVIGLGPSLSLLSASRRLEWAVLIAPSVGFGLTALVATYLVSFDQPVRTWTRTWLWLALTASLALGLAQRTDLIRAWQSTSRRLLLAYGGALTASTVLVLLPLHVGGLSFMILRGNGTDTFNYLTLAGYLDHEPYSWATTVSARALIQSNPLYALAKELLFTRWTTSAVLAWSSDIASIQHYRFEYGFSVLSLLVSLGPTLLLVWTAGVGIRLAALIAVATTVGFWAQFVLDIKAISQINSIPITLAIALLATRLFGRQALTHAETALLSLMLAGLALFYIEVLPTVVIGLGLVFLLSMSRTRESLKRFRQLAAAGIGALVLLAPDWSHLGQFLRFQLESAATRPNDWSQAYFAWLYQNPLVGTWGMSYLAPNNQITLRLLVAVTLALGMSALMVWRAVRAVRLRQKEPWMLVLICLAGAALAEFVFLFTKAGLWAGGKAVSFAYPFLTLAACSVRVSFGGVRWIARDRVLSLGAAGLVVAWSCLQVGLGIQRIRLASAGIDPPNYVNNHGSYRRHDWDISSIRNVILSEKPATLWVVSSDPWLLQFLELALGWDTRISEPGGVRRRDGGELIGFQSLEPSPFLLIRKDDWWNRDQMPGALAAQNSEFALVRTPGPSDQQPLVVLGSQDASGTQLQIVSPAAGRALISVQFAGRNLASQPPISVIVRGAMDQQDRSVALTDSPIHVTALVSEGLNTLRFEVEGANAERVRSADEYYLPVAGLQALLQVCDTACGPSPAAARVGSRPPALGD